MEAAANRYGSKACTGTHSYRACLFLLASRIAALACALWMPGSATGQAPRDLSSAISTATGLQLEPDGTWLGVGPGYAVRFEERGIVYTPVLGREAPRNLPLSFALESVARGEHRQPVASGNLTAQGTQVVLEHGFVTQTYSLRSDGVKQDFVFSELPAGEGDLIVRGRIQTELTPSPHVDATEGVLFQWPKVGGVRFGKVMGVDAHGNVCAGSMRLDGEHVEFVLPGAFVAGAALPLTVDPLIGTYVVQTTPPGVAPGAYKPDIAWDVGSSVWLCIWAEGLYNQAGHVYGMRVGGDGTPIGPKLLIGTVSNFNYYVDKGIRVANVRASGRFVVVWSDGYYVWARAVVASDGSLSNLWRLPSGATGVQTPVVGGNRSPTEPVALVAWSGGASILQGVRLEATANGGLQQLGSVVTLHQEPVGLLSEPAISRSGGPAGNWALVWHDWNPTGRRYRGMVVTSDLSTVRGVRTLATATPTPLVGAVQYAPDVDGDGEQWVVVYPDPEPVAQNPVLYDTSCLGWRLTPSGTEVTTPIRLPDYVQPFAPGVAWVGNSAFIHCEDFLAIIVHTVDPFTCASSEPMGFVGHMSGRTEFMGAASQYAAGADTDIVAFLSAGEFSRVNMAVWDAADGEIRQSAPACGNGGTIYAPCARVGNGAFGLQLRRAGPGAIGFRVLGLQYYGASCGSCTLVPDPYTGFVDLVGATDANGDLRSALSIPNDPMLVGASLYAQFALTGTACTLGIDLSSAIRVTLE